MGQSIAADDLATAFPMVIAMVWAVATLVIGFAGKRPRNHYLRRRARNRQPLWRVSVRPWLAQILIAGGAHRKLDTPSA